MNNVHITETSRDLTGLCAADHSGACLCVHIFRAPDNRATPCCPYHDDTASTCRAALSQFFVTAVRKLRYCRTEDHDDCPLFLGKVLRNRR